MNGFLNEQLSGSRAHSTVALAAIGLLLIYILPLKGESILSRPWGSTLFIDFPNLSELFRPANEFVVAHTPTVSRRNPEPQQPHPSCSLGPTPLHKIKTHAVSFRGSFQARSKALCFQSACERIWQTPLEETSRGVKFCGSLAEYLENRKAGGVSHHHQCSKKTSRARFRCAHCLTIGPPHANHSQLSG